MGLLLHTFFTTAPYPLGLHFITVSNAPGLLPTPWVFFLNTFCMTMSYVLGLTLYTLVRLHSMLWAFFCIHFCNSILCSGFLLYADLGLCSVFFVYALQPYPGLWVLFCMHFRTVSDTPVFFCIRFLWPRPVLWVFCRMYFYDSILCSSSPFVFIFTTISYDMGLPLYASLRLYPMRCAFFCMHVYNCILCSGPSLVYILMIVSYALALLLSAFLRPYRDFSCIIFLRPYPIFLVFFCIHLYDQILHFGYPF